MKGMIFMGKKDTLTKQYVSDNTIFADICNYYIYGGKNIILPEHLHPLDINESITLDQANDSVWTVEKQRDVIKYASVDDTAYLVIGIENQSDVHYAMPVRNMLYDALQYTSQIKEKATAVQNNTTKKTGTEYISGLKNNDALIPVVTIVLYFGNTPWDGPRSLHQMLSNASPEVLQYVSNYEIQLITPQELSDDELAMFRSNLQQVLKFIKYQKDKEKMDTLMHSADYTSLDKSAIRVINEFAHLKLKPKYIDEEESDMCQAWDEHYEDGRNEGRNEERKEMALKLLKDNVYSLEKIADLTELPLEEIEALQKAI